MSAYAADTALTPTHSFALTEEQEQLCKEIREFAAIHSAFETMQKRLRRFVSERTHMLASISHDLRTPLTRLRLQAEFVGGQQHADRA